VKLNQLFTITALSFLSITAARALTYETPKSNGCIIGNYQQIRVGAFTSIPEIDQKYDVGIDEMQDANVVYSFKHTLPTGTQLLIPTRFILPNAPRKGIVINLAERRVYYFDQQNHLVDTFPAGIGKVGWDTPLGSTQIVKKTVSPTWIPTVAVRKDFLNRYGFPLPDSFPPGPDNPLGDYAIRLGFTNILIHGTNDPGGVGGRVSAGCIRMFDDDIGRLFESVYVGTSVTIVNQPYKTGWQGKTLYFEAHPPLNQKPGEFVGGYKKVIEAAIKHAPAGKVQVDWKLADQVAHLQMGVPEAIGHVN